MWLRVVYALVWISWLAISNYLTPWHMEPGGSMLPSQGLSNNPYPLPNQPNSRIDTYLFKVHSNIVLPSKPSFPKGPFPVGLPVTILKPLLPSSILATCPAHLNLLDLITLTILGERYKLCSSSLWNHLHSPFSSIGNNRDSNVNFLLILVWDNASWYV